MKVHEAFNCHKQWECELYIWGKSWLSILPISMIEFINFNSLLESFLIFQIISLLAFITWQKYIMDTQILSQFKSLLDLKKKKKTQTRHYIWKLTNISRQSKISYPLTLIYFRMI